MPGYNTINQTVILCIIVNYIITLLVCLHEKCVNNLMKYRGRAIK